MGSPSGEVPESPPRDFQVHLNAPKGIEEGCGEERECLRGGGNERGNVKAPSHFGGHFHRKRGPKKTSQKRNPHWSIFWDPENPQKAARAEFSGVSHGTQKRGPRPGVQKVRCCHCLLHLSWVQGLKKGPRFGTILGSCFPKKTKKGVSRKVLKIGIKKALETDPNRDPI